MLHILSRLWLCLLHRRRVLRLLVVLVLLCLRFGSLRAVGIGIGEFKRWHCYEIFAPDLFMDIMYRRGSVLEI